MTDPDVIPGTERHPDAGQPPPPQDAPEKTAAPTVPASPVPAGRVWRLIGQHKLGTAIAALLVAAAAVGVATGSLNGAPAASTGNSAGQQGSIVYSSPAAAPAFSVPALLESSAAAATAGQQVSLSQYAGKPLIVNFFASWCEPCQRETPLLASFYKGNHGQVTMIGVDGDDPAANAVAFVRAKGVSYPVGVDAHLIIAGAYNVGAFPQTFFLDSRHRIVYRVIGGVTQAQLTEGVRLMDRS
jgi:cytochrome c biogenesis protein CcmG, thiol:disulfide interchange protein DsbE